ncbi:MAG: hypothetical protein ACREYA_36915 [Cupriavidus necator]
MTKERPILFSGAMVRAILDGRKTQTRRIIKLPPAPETLGTWEPTTIGGGTSTFADGTPGPEMAAIWHTRTGATLACRHGHAGDRLWVRETWAQPAALDPGPTVYRSDYPACVPRGFENIPPAEAITWKPSIHMPRALCRLVLEITVVRVELLQDCSEADAIAEGIERRHSADGEWAHYADTGLSTDARGSYRSLWEQINGPASWDANPWVWVVEFRRVQR